MSKPSIITGVTEKMAPILVSLFLSKGYQVYGAYRRTSSVNFWRLRVLGVADHERIKLAEFDLTEWRPRPLVETLAWIFAGAETQQIT